MSDGIKLSEQQISIVRNFCDGGQDMIVHGGAGTGKSTLIAAIVHALTDQVAVYTPTHASAAVLTAKGIDNVKQVASMRYDNQLNELADSDVTHVVIDEASMIGRSEMLYLTAYVCAGDKPKHILFIGDPKQLPPVSNHSANLRPDWFSLETPDYVLQHQYRQEANVAPVVVNDASDVTTYDAVITMTNEKRGELNAQIHVDRYGDEAFAKSRPLAKVKNGVLMPKVGQDLICHETDKHQTYLNNVTYRIESIVIENKAFRVKFENKRSTVLIPHEDFMQDKVKSGAKSRWSFAYAMTCHSAQGREFDNVLVMIDADYNGIHTKYGIDNSIIHRWLYTALTRGKKVIHVYDPENAIEHDNLSLDITPAAAVAEEAAPGCEVAVIEPVPASVVEPVVEPDMPAAETPEQIVQRRRQYLADLLARRPAHDAPAKANVIPVTRRPDVQTAPIQPTPELFTLIDLIKEEYGTAATFYHHHADDAIKGSSIPFDKLDAILRNGMLSGVLSQMGKQYQYSPHAATAR